MAATSPLTRLLAAQQRRLTRDQRLDTLSLTAVRKKVPNLDVAQAVTSAKVRLTIAGPSTLELSIEDPLWLVEDSGLLDRSADGRLDAIVVAVDKLRFRLVKAERQSPETLSLTFEDHAKAILSRHRKPMSNSRGSMTRAQFVERMIAADDPARDLVFFAPEITRKQPVARPDLPDVRPHGTTGFDDGATFKVKGVAADAQQMREAATILGVCDQEGATERVRVAAFCAAIGESSIRPVMNQAGSPYGGVFQGNVRGGVFRVTDTEGMARSFLKGGKGFQGGGAIAYARANPAASAGKIALVVEGSRSNFSSDEEAERFYQQHHAEAKRIVGLWNSGDGASGSQVVTFKQYRFTRGLPGKKETTWQAATRLAEEVGWRFYALGGVVCFTSDDYLITQPAWHTFDGQGRDGGWVLPDGLLERPTYTWDEGRTAAEVDLKVVADAWSVIPGECVTISSMGPCSGRWIVETFEFDLLDVTQGEVTLIKPIPPKKEPAAEAITVTPGSGDDSDLPAGAQRAVAWAQSRVGHYKEEWGANRGEELDRLQAKFNMRGEPWCAIFATTAAVMGGTKRECRTALVADIARWCQEGSHGYQRGFRKTPRPGDLMVFNTGTPSTADDHVGVVEKVSDGGRKVTTIEGNVSAGQVSRVSRLSSSGRFVRPDYPN